MTTQYTKYDNNPDLQASILSEDPFLYAHLVKFERIPNTASGLIAEEPNDYSYITDASFDISFNDGSKSVAGTANGSQTYVAGRLLSVGNIADTTEAKVSNVTLTISAISLGSKFTASAENNSATPPVPNNRVNVLNSTSSGCDIKLVDTDFSGTWLDLGFSEGDRITVSSGDGNNNLSVTISSFEDNNFTASCILPNQTPTNATNRTDYTITYETDEVTAVLDDPASTTYNNYINREVTIYKAHIDPDNGNVIGSPYLLFKGIISKAKITDDPNKNSVVTWTLTSHWGDFIRVNGRLTVDDSHRALGSNGKPDIAALYRDDYAFDYGFVHGNQAINIIAIYQVQETRYKLKKSGLFGLKTKMKEYQVTVDRDVDLRLNLEAKYLPVIYGVQRTDSIPVFADSLANDPKKIYVAYAICEGEVSGLYDIYVDDQSRVCIDQNDFDTRSTQTGEETIDVICEGRMDRGDTLSSAASVMNSRLRGMPRAPAGYNYYGGGIYSGLGNWLNYYYFAQNLVASAPDVGAATGVTHQKQTTLKYPISSRLVFHAGRSHQRADDTLVRIAKAGAATASAGFKLQSDLSNNADERKDYWTQNHRLLDTAYVVAEFTIAEGDTTIPELDFVVRGKEIEQYNYDYSYRQHPNPTFSSGTITDKRALFKVNNSVDFYRLDNSGANNGRLATGVQIMDATEYLSARAETVHKFRFDSDPLQGTDVREFYMVPTGTAYNSDSRYPMITWNYKSHSGTVPGNLYQTVTESSGDGNATVQNTGTGGGTGVDFTELAAKIQAALELMGNNLSIGLILNGQSIADRVAEFLKSQANPSTDGSGNTQDNDVAETQVDKDQITTYALLNAIQLASSASSTNDYYNGQFITLIQTDAEGIQNRQTREIIDYDGTEKIAYVGSLVDVAADATAVTGTFVVTAKVNNSLTFTLTSVTNLAVGHVISGVSDAMTTIPSGTTVTAINTSTKLVTVDQPVKLMGGAVLNAHASGGADTKQKEPSDWDVIPTTGDKYEIRGAGDTKVSINPAIQLLDYLTNGRYGRGLEIYTAGSDTDEKDIDLESFKAAARQCDTRSDVNLILPNSTYADDDAWNSAVSNAHKWEYLSTISGTPYHQWEGTIKSVSKNANGTVLNSAGTGYVQVTFTNCIGKIVHRWHNWKSYDVGNAVYHRVGTGVNARNKVYLVTSAGTIAEPSSGNAASLTIQRTTSSSTTAAVHGVSSGGATEADSGEQINPVVKSWTGGSYEKSGYSIYDSDDVKYWRYLGWQSQDQREVTRHQTNALIRTDTPVFNNVNSMLEHFNGILRYVGGKYQLDVESTTPAITNKAITTTANYTGTQAASTSKSYTDPRIITDEDIIGAITVDDAGLKGSANTVSVSISDPNIRYDTRSVSFFKSEYLKEDRNIPKKKDVKTPLVTNYFNARMNAEQYLDQSRFNRKINFVIGSKGLLLLSGTIIKITYDRFGWVNKEYRISNLTYRADCSVQVTAQEHNDNSYIVTPKEKNIGARPAAAGPGDESASPSPPSGLTATGASASVELTWNNTVGFGDGAETGWSTQIWYNINASYSHKTANTDFENGAVLLHTTTTESHYLHKTPNILTDTTFYYWIRHVKDSFKVKNTKIKESRGFSAFTPLTNQNGVAGTATAGAGSSGIIFLYKSSINAPTDDPSNDSTFPTLVVDLSGANAGKITGVASGQGSAALTSNQVIDTAGNATGWYTVPQNPTNDSHIIWIVAATANAAGSTDDILRGEWTDPPTKFSGAKGLNQATVELFQLNNNASNPTTDGPNGGLTYTFATGTLSGSNFNSWSVTASTPTSSNKYLWKITAAAIGAGDTDTINADDWSTAKITSNFAEDGQPGPSVTGPSGKRSVQGYIYFRAAAGASSPFASGGTGTYNFTSGTITGTLSPNVTYQNEPYVVDVAGSYSYWTARYFYTDASSGLTSNTVTATITAAVQHTSFTGVVTFSGGTFNQNGSSVYNTTTIDGAHITTGTIAGPNFANTGGTNGGGAKLLLTLPANDTDSVFETRNKAGAAVFKITKAGNITAENFTLNSGSIAGSVTIGGAASSSFATNTSAKTGGSVAGWTINSTTIVGADGTSNITLDSANRRITITESGTERVRLGQL